MKKYHKTHKARATHRIIRSFEARAMKRRTPAEKLADWLTGFFGSLSFLVLNIILFIFWILINTGHSPLPIFDPFPFVLLITLVSLQAIILSIVVLMSQNRERKIATLRDELQLQVELITEKELSKALLLITRLLHEKGIKFKDEELEEMLSAIDASYIERKLEDQLEGKID